MNKKLMVGALAVALVGGGFAGSTLLTTTHAATPSTSNAQQGNDKEVQDDAVKGAAPQSVAATTSNVNADVAGDKEVNDGQQGQDKEVKDGQQGQDQETTDGQQGQDQETNDGASQAPAGK